MSDSLGKGFITGRTITDQLETQDDQYEIINLGRPIKNLFDLLPIIRRIRRTHLLRQESEDFNKATVTAQESDSMTSATYKAVAPRNPALGSTLRLSFSRLLEHSLDLASILETVLHNDEDWAVLNGEMFETNSGKLRKETDRPREYEKVKKGKRDMADMQQAVSTSAKALQETIKDIAVPVKPIMHVMDAPS